MIVQTEACMWCLGEFKTTEGPVHEYIQSTPGCWAAYGRLLAKEYENYEQFSNIHRLTTDTYAIQHPGQTSRKSTQSVWGHLIALYFVLIKNLDGDSARNMLKIFVESKPQLEWLAPPSFEGTLTVADVLQANSDNEHIALVQKWTDSVWNVWYTKHKEKIDSAANMLQS